MRAPLKFQFSELKQCHHLIGVQLSIIIIRADNKNTSFL